MAKQSVLVALILVSLLVHENVAYICFCVGCQFASIGTCCKTDCCSCENHGVFDCDKNNECHIDGVHDSEFICEIKTLMHPDDPTKDIRKKCCYPKDDSLTISRKDVDSAYYLSDISAMERNGNPTDTWFMKYGVNNLFVGSLALVLLGLVALI
eukprot:200367_1